MTNDQKKYDLEERTAKFAEDVIRFCKIIKISDINKPLINQLIRANQGRY